MRSRAIVLVLLVLLAPLGRIQAQSLNLALGGYGLSIGNSRRMTGVRLNAVDRDVEKITGLNLTLWNPGQNPDAVFDGVTLGVIGTKAKRIHGLALSGIGVNAREYLGGMGAGLLGVGAGSLTGVAAGLIMVDVKDRFKGINLAGFWTGISEELDGMAFSLGAATAKQLRGVAVGGVLVGGQEGLTGLAIGGGGVFAAHFKGVAVGGVGGGFESMDGVALSLGGLGGKTLDGIMLAGVGLGAEENVRGVAVGGLVAFAPEVTGFMMGALNGLYIDRIDLEDFLHFNTVNHRFTGISLGLVNYSARLQGVQLGLINYAGNNPCWLRLLPFVNVHL